MNAIVSFRKCTLTDEDLVKAVDKATDDIYKKAQAGDYSPPPRHIPARPNEDYDLIVGELIMRFREAKELNKEQNSIYQVLGKKARDLKDTVRGKIVGVYTDEEGGEVCLEAQDPGDFSMNGRIWVNVSNVELLE